MFLCPRHAWISATVQFSVVGATNRTPLFLLFTYSSRR
jgi:hypothetical protein